MKLVNLEYLRTYVGKTLEEVADTLNVSKSTILNWEKSPENLSVDKLVSYANAIGYRLEDLFEYKEEQKMVMKFNDNAVLNSARKKLQEYIQQFENYEYDSTLLKSPLLEEFVRELQSIRQYTKKPSIALVGPSDSGKSTLINYLLGSEIVPARWTPATGTIIRVIHTSDKPRWLNDNTLIVKNNNGRVANLELWDLQDEKDNRVVDSGSRDLIAKFGDRIGDAYDVGEAEMLTIFTFVDAPILNHCEIWDTPGISAGNDDEGESDQAQSVYARASADILVYTSVINQFLHKDSVDYLKPAIRRLNSLLPHHRFGVEPFGNLFVLGTQAQIISNKLEVQQILERGAERLAKNCGNSTFSEVGYTRTQLKSRFYPFSIDIESYAYDFTKVLLETLEQASRKLFTVQKERLAKATERFMALITEEIEQLTDDKAEEARLRAEFQVFQDNLPNLLDNHSQMEKELTEKVRLYKLECKHEYMEYYKSTMTQESLVELMKERDVKNDKESKEEFVSWLETLHQEKLGQVLYQFSNNMSDVYGQVLSKVQEKSPVSTQYFDYEAVTASILTGGIIGGAFLWSAATTASNLGLYILAAKIGGILTSLGIISSPTVLVTVIAATGGPVVWAIGLTVGAMLAVGALLGLSQWQSKLAKHLIATYEENRMSEKMCEAIDAYAQDWLKGAQSYVRGLDEKANEHLSTLKEKIKSTPEQFDEVICHLGCLRLKAENFVEDMIVETNYTEEDPAK